MSFFKYLPLIKKSEIIACRTKDEKICKIPWIDAVTGEKHTGCSKGNTGDWCPTELNEHNIFEMKSGKWGLCGDNCPSDYSKYNIIESDL